MIREETIKTKELFIQCDSCKKKIPHVRVEVNEDGSHTLCIDSTRYGEDFLKTDFFPTGTGEERLIVVKGKSYHVKCLLKLI